MPGSGKSSTSFRRRLAAVNQSVREIKPAQVRAAITGRNAAFALGAAFVVILIWIFNAGPGGDDDKTAALRGTEAVSPSAVVEDMTKPTTDDGADEEDSPARQAALKRPKIDPLYQENVEVDVSSRSVPVTAGFSGQRIVVFGAVHNSQQASKEQGLYDVVVVLEGEKSPLITRRKSNVAGIWINTNSVKFKNAPSYYMISSNRPIEQISTPRVFDEHEIGFRHVRLEPVEGALEGKSEEEIQSFREALVRLKANEGLYQKRDSSVQFIGKSLFRTSVDLPANVPIGTVIARTYLFRDAELIAENTAAFQLERRGFEELMYSFAFDYPLFYGMFAVLMAVGAGLAASAIFSKGSH